MLTDLQTAKLTHFFHILDFNRNGVITEEDFVAIAENLCVLWNFDEGTEQFNIIMNKCHHSWNVFISFMNDSEAKSAALPDWLEFAAANLVNADDQTYAQYISNIVAEIFDYFDVNRDRFISVDEFMDMFVAFRIEIRYSAKAFTKMDLNGDEYLSREELLTAVSQYFRSDDEKDKGNWLFGFWLVNHGDQ